ncbi:hypothetical protein [Ancylobacter polymorphus]|uniref:Uncharacterized protein n=1 Tax=Ancylobacter polymorphus TaxID=223390 RepID=A0ABU0BD93_9HYPH|nr:hypothetical protein [Ancylobacter polymorphus]MDQ0303800.1 hypothetical protein [Ancylobacter polymorphus]
MAGFLSGFADQLGNLVDERRAVSAYEPLLNAVYGGQPQQQSGGFLSNLLGGGAPRPAQAGGAQEAPMPAQGGMGMAPGMGGGSPQIDRQAILGLLQRPETREQGVALLMNGGRLPQPRTNLPADVQEYQFALQQGFKGSFLDYQTALRKAGASSTSVTVNPAAGENAFQKSFGETQAKRYSGMIEQGDQANALLGDVAALRELGQQIQTGTGAQAIARLGPYAEALGINIQGLPAAQAYEAVVSRIAPRLRVPGSGAQSDFELQQFMRSLPSLGNTPEGNAVIANTLEGVAQNQRAAAEIARAAGMGEITRQEADRRLQALPDPFTAWRQQNNRSPVQESAPPAQRAPAAPGAVPPGVDPQVWQFMTPEERALWNSL